MRSCDLSLVTMWFIAGGAEGLRHLPQAGGLMDQAAIMMDSFAVVRSAVAAWRDLTKSKE